ncbi:cupin domain-containing protein [Asticcacaulis sp. ZE23SCel15]|uniref:cupin domain-containing protein n=1 Tax=Asticcacaulis sp. ZE23SCel15 TaxID=3059027 RepID=UPI00265F632A|nr:cupin domain-containing protein [Asticcacaulis sp. ZE23SCel15]WKL56005.1 cupin domain-containing protein [Asticcacaulis sp. ZE23SCel15]
MKALTLWPIALSLLIAAPAAAQTPDAPTERARLTPGDIAALSKASAGAGTSGMAGIETTVLYGDPTQAGLYTIKLQVPPHTRIAAHSHRDNRSAIVISGEWYFGYGPLTDDIKVKKLTAGSFYTEPVGDPHFAITRDQSAIVYITGMGPTDTVYVDASKDPRK